MDSYSVVERHGERPGDGRVFVDYIRRPAVVVLEVGEFHSR